MDVVATFGPRSATFASGYVALFAPHNEKTVIALFFAGQAAGFVKDWWGLHKDWRNERKDAH